MDQQSPQPGQQPPPPKMFDGIQGVFLVLVLIAAVVGWVLYINLWYQQPTDGTAKTNTSVSSDTEVVDEDYTYTPTEKTFAGEAITLPKPSLSSNTSVEEAMQSRRSARAFTDQALSASQLGQMLWAAQGQTSEWGGRTAPSARSIYPYSFYVVIRNVTDITDGLYLYLPDSHSIRPLIETEDLLTGDAQQDSVKNAPAVFVYGAIYNKTLEKFQPLESAVKVTLQESGHIGQNVYLEAESLGLATVVVGGFDPTAVANELHLASDETVVYLQPFGIEDTTAATEE